MVAHISVFFPLRERESDFTVEQLWRDLEGGGKRRIFFNSIEDPKGVHPDEN